MAAYFSLILVLVTLSSGLVWMADALFFAPKRREKLAMAQAAQADLSEESVDKIMRESALVETSKSIFPVIAFVLILRSFIYEPFQIPSGSMMPTLLVGDFILVEKFSYGIKDPVWRTTLKETGKPERGDVAVFKYPVNPQVDYIKRIIGLPGDRIIYRNKELYIQPACKEGQSPCPELKMVDRALVNRGEFSQNGTPLLRYKEQIGDVSHDILINPSRPDMISHFFRQDNVPLTEFVVPEGQYFAMGDNRDNSQDSRYWGFVPEQNLVGKAVAIWISFEFDRAPADFLPTWIPTGVRFNRVGGIE
ncbi:MULTISPECIES: signal peptidase I [unclassified Shewanella]|uniref:signal peptidase I n=1 Tax=unclassified Shewanella TaxID=196818 RepID=UPI001BBAB9CF|nr:MULTISPECIES: signal peptidase I [unclassified Shewanella]GIU17860.1 signal peptidase I [Shewanella sp. MBTL60-112-B1]GIU33273.1 signal peptidase I [Shewanella sp. MBTL60-112-B2]